MGTQIINHKYFILFIIFIPHVLRSFLHPSSRQLPRTPVHIQSCCIPTLKSCHMEKLHEDYRFGNLLF